MNMVMILCGLGIILLAFYVQSEVVCTDKQQEVFNRLVFFLCWIVIWGALATIQQHLNPKIDEPLTVVKAVTPDGAAIVTYAIDNDGKMHQYNKELNEGYTLVNRYVPGAWYSLVYCVEGQDDIVPVKKDNLE